MYWWAKPIGFRFQHEVANKTGIPAEQQRLTLAGLGKTLHMPKCTLAAYYIGDGSTIIVIDLRQEKAIKSHGSVIIYVDLYLSTYFNLFFVCFWTQVAS